MKQVTTPPEVRRFLFRTLVAPLVIAGAVIIFSIFLITHFKKNQLGIVRTDALISKIDRMELAAIYASDNFNAYWYSGKPTYLKSAWDNSRDYYSLYSQIEKLVAKNAAQTALLKKTGEDFSRWHAFADTALTQREAKKPVAAFFETAKNLAGETLSSGETLIYNVTDQRTQVSEDTISLATKATGALAALTFVITIILSVSGRRSLIRTTKIYADTLRAEQNALDQAHSALATRDEFLSVASHELKTPLTSLKLQLQMTERALRFRADPSPVMCHLRQSMNTALRQTNSLTDLVDQLLDIARIQSGRFALSLDRTDLNSVIKDIVGRYESHFRSAKTPVCLDLQGDLIGYWDRFRIEQIIVNLLSNAIRYASRHPIYVTTRLERDHARLEVRDFGPGIAAEKREKIFDRYERAGLSRSQPGLGLGLFITKNIVVAHGGVIFVDPEVVDGSKFVVELPLRVTIINHSLSAAVESKKTGVETAASGESHVV